MGSEHVLLEEFVKFRVITVGNYFQFNGKHMSNIRHFECAKYRLKANCLGFWYCSCLWNWSNQMQWSKRTPAIWYRYFGKSNTNTHTHQHSKGDADQFKRKLLQNTLQFNMISRNVECRTANPMYTPYKVETTQRAFNQNLETVVAMPCAHTVCKTIVGWLVFFLF